MSPIQPQVNKQRPQGPKIIKKYGNRKLYDTEQSSYVVLKDIEKMIRNQEEIQVIDNETQDDITISTLTQIIFSSEKKSKVSPPIDILQSIIREGDGSFSAFLAKMGLFEVTEEQRVAKDDANNSKSIFSSGKTINSNSQSLGQKIESLMTSDEGSSSPNMEDKIPDLPGNKLS